MNYKELIHSAREALVDVSESPQLDAEVLLAHLLQKDRLWLVAHGTEEPADELCAQFDSVIARRLTGEPVAYLVGAREFYGRNFEVNPSVLIPRPETELLVEGAIRFIDALPASPSSRRVLELGTGSGCIIVTLASELSEHKNLEFIATDMSEEALKVAVINAKNLGVEDSISFIKSDWFSDIPNQTFDCIVSNPPYVARDAELKKDLSFEPSSALFSEDQGVADVIHIISEARNYLKPGGKLFLECGEGQPDQLVESTIVKDYYTASIQKDLQNIGRVLELVLL